MNLRLEAGTDGKDQEEIITSDKEQNPSNDQISSENSDSSKRMSAKHANLMKMNEEESIEWVNMQKK